MSSNLAWAAPLIPDLVSESISELRKLGFTGTDKADAILRQAQALYTEAEAIRTDRNLSQEGKDAKHAEMKNRQTNLKNEIHQLKAQLQEQSREVAQRRYQSFPEPSETARDIAFRTLEKRGFTADTIYDLWESGNEYQGFVTRHLATYAKLSGADNLESVTWAVQRLTGVDRHANLINGLTNNLNTLLTIR
jgi:hypothetical protein